MPYHELREWVDNELRVPYSSKLFALVQIDTQLTASYRGAQLVLALELYRREHNRYPADLSALVPAYFEEVPVDPFIDQPFVYRVGHGGYWLYSVGRDLTDSNGHQKKDMLIRKPKSTSRR